MARTAQAAAQTGPRNPTATADAGGETVTVACKLPSGVILRLFKMQDVDEQVMGGGVRTVQKAFPDTEAGIVVIKGCAMRDNAPLLNAGGYALTRKVSKDFWEEWCRQNSDSDLLRNHVLYAEGDRERASDRGEEQAEVRSGLHPLEMPNVEGVDVSRPDYRMPRSPRKGVSAPIGYVQDDAG